MPDVSGAGNEMAAAWPCFATDVTFFLSRALWCCTVDASGFWILVSR